jgi:hypothetical protein
MNPLQAVHHFQITEPHSSSLKLCYPVPAPDWYVLFAIQQWNIQTNTIIRALSYGVNFVQGTPFSVATSSHFI